MSGQTDRGHEVYLTMRRELKISGVKEVESFDDTGAVFHTLCGDLTVEGQEIHISVLDVDRGDVVLSGKIDAIFYPSDSTSEKKRFLGKFMR